MEITDPTPKTMPSDVRPALSLLCEIASIAIQRLCVMCASIMCEEDGGTMLPPVHDAFIVSFVPCRYFAAASNTVFAFSASAGEERYSWSF